MKITHIRSAAIVLGVAVALAACGKKDEAPAPVVAPAPAPVVVAPAPAPMVESASFAGVSVGNSVDASQNVAAPMTTFAPGDTIYASVMTKGAAPNAAIAVRWTFGDGQLIDESSQSIVPTGAAITTFHIAKPEGWPVGKYKVDVSLDGKPVGSQEFEVK